jgi:outer membrane protein OmpA-like peptidoglycan-associated protein
LAILGASLTTAAPDAHAQPYFQKGAIEIGLQLGGLFFLDGDAVPFDPAGSGFPGPLEDTFAYTLSGTYSFTRHLGLELALQLSPAEVNRLTIFSLHLDAIWHPISHNWIVPFVGAGPSFSLLLPQKDYANDTDPGINLVAGAKILPWKHIGIRADLRYLLRIPTAGDAPDGRSEVAGHDLIASVGLFGTFGGEVVRKKPPVLLDTDGDGILDQSDACPQVPGKASAQGCPDKDEDTLADDKDRCPDVAGPPAQQGCPDTDGDTLVDLDDRCPKDAGPLEHKGCPDGDGDKIANLDDKCPTIPGMPEHGGCPPPPPAEVVKKFTGVMKGITFERDKDIIRKTSFKTLDEAVQVMKDYPQIRLLVEGHTSSEGTREHNLDLSERRAKSVRQYMVDKGIGVERIDTKGFGPDVPVADNKTEAGRSKNRRIEFKIFQPE